ncbi:MAG TPA: hypothetical protein VGT60_11130 [Candidatus Limnocylindria bacterium]|nr:hypothetical protein [Candidatus Limnocylindria bacterium]
MRWPIVTVPAYVIAGGALHFPGSLDAVGLEPGPLALGAVTGLLIGAAQLVALRGVLLHPWLWPLATAAGMAITHAAGDGLSAAAGYLPVAIVGGIALGVSQGAVLRQPLWVLATAAGLFIGIYGGYTLAFGLGFNSIFEQDALPRHASMTGLSAALYALFTAPIVARMRPPRRLTPAR